MKRPIAVLFLRSFLFSCSKDGENNNSITGTWNFTSQDVVLFPFPTILNAPSTNPIGVANQSSSTGAIHVTFDSNGNYSFTNNNLPVDNGTYTVIRDSILVIKPDTSGFIKFHYTYLTAYASTGLNTPPPPPYTGFVYSSDTLYFHFVSGNLRFVSAWITKPYAPVFPSGDTLILNEGITNFKRR